MTLEDLLTEITERGWEVSLHGPALGWWEAKVRGLEDEHRVFAIGFARDRDPAHAVERALAKCDRGKQTEQFVPTGSIDTSEEPSLLAKLGLAKKPLGIVRRI